MSAKTAAKTESGERPRPTFEPVRSRHTADAIFEQLATAILHGDLVSGEPMPSERVLGTEFGVSRMILRQAIHRLADVGLVRVRQGGATLILDPAEARDIRLIGLYYRADRDAETSLAVRRDVIEKQFLQGLSLIDVFARRASAAEKKRIHALTIDFDETTSTESDFEVFEETFWRAVARAGKNRIFQMETAWWYEGLDLPRSRPENPPRLQDRIAFYRELARRVLEGGKSESATQYYLDVVGPQLDAIFESGRRP